MARPRKLTEEQVARAVAAHRRAVSPWKALAADLKVSDRTLRRWRARAGGFVRKKAGFCPLALLALMRRPDSR